MYILVHCPGRGHVTEGYVIVYTISSSLHYLSLQNLDATVTQFIKFEIVQTSKMCGAYIATPLMPSSVYCNFCSSKTSFR